MSNDAARDAALQAVTTTGGGEAMLGMAALGKTALVLLLLVGVILLTVVASRAVGAKERVVVVDVDGTRLVLGVGGGRISRLHQYPAPDAPADGGAPSADGDAPFSARFAQALKQNLRGGRG